MNSKTFIFFIHFSQPGSLGLSFGINGKVITSLSPLNDIAQDVA